MKIQNSHFELYHNVTVFGSLAMQGTSTFLVFSGVLWTAHGVCGSEIFGRDYCTCVFDSGCRDSELDLHTLLLSVNTKVLET